MECQKIITHCAEVKRPIAGSVLIVGEITPFYTDGEAESRETLCQERFPQLTHFMNQRGSPADLQRIPPISQTDLEKPHEQETIHERE